MTPETKRKWLEVLNNENRNPYEILDLLDQGLVYDEPQIKIWVKPTDTEHTISICFLHGVMRNIESPEDIASLVSRMAKYVDFTRPPGVPEYLSSAVNWAFTTQIREPDFLVGVIEGLQRGGAVIEQSKFDLLGWYLSTGHVPLLRPEVVRKLQEYGMSLDHPYDQDAFGSVSLREHAARGNRRLANFLLGMGEWLPISDGFQDYKMRLSDHE